MTITIDRLPFILALGSTLLPVAGALTNVPVYHGGAVLVLGAALLPVLFARAPLVIHVCWINRSLALLVLLLVLQVSTRRGFVTLATGGYVLIFTAVFYNMFHSSNALRPQLIAGWVDRLFKWLLLTLLGEWLLVRAGYQPTLQVLLTGSTSSTYKLGNGADFAHLFGLLGPNATGLNSLLLGSQIAGMLALFGLVWFVGTRTAGGLGRSVPAARLWTLLAAILLVVTMVGTVMLLLLLTITLFFVVMRRRYRTVFLWLIAGGISGLYSLAMAGLFLPRVFNARLVRLPPEQVLALTNSGLLYAVDGLTTFGYYLFEFSRPLVVLFTSGPASIVLGVGATYLLTTNEYMSGDFGFGAALLSSGVAWMVVFTTTVLLVCVPALPLVERTTAQGLSWARLAAVNGLLSLLWLASTVHYNQAFSNPSGIVLFALHLALTLYARERADAADAADAAGAGAAA